ncbi:MAG: hypothetical protein QF381_02045 [Nitrososphaerales archaeon]|jgi:hypothetical protein|nr:hypothetical protein [Nitrososphaerales archaeon]|tara:strand:- start:858 stop:2102 length:1245 start_codon:yes stop_codon:yes gene_type:complete
MNIGRTFIVLGLILILSSPIVLAASITVVASKTEYNPGDTLVILGTATPGSAVAIQIYNPAGNLVGVDQSNTRGDGQYVVEVFNFPEIPTVMMPYGTYLARAVDAATGESAEIYIEYTVSTSPPVIPKDDTPDQPLVLQIIVRTGSSYQLGDEVRVVILFNYNGTAVDPFVKTANVHLPSVGQVAPETISLVAIDTGLFYFDYTPNELGTYVVQVEGTANGTSNIRVETFHITERFATEVNLNDVENTIVDRIALAQSDIVENVNDAISSVQNNVNNLEEKINSLQTIIEETVLSSRNILQGAISSAVTEIDGQISSAQSDIESNIGSQIELSEETIILAIDGVQTTVVTSVVESGQTISSGLSQSIDSVDTMKTNLDSVSAGVSSASVWITVVGIIAAITLALELVMFVRKIS